MLAEAVEYADHASTKEKLYIFAIDAAIRRDFSRAIELYEKIVAECAKELKIVPAKICT